MALQARAIRSQDRARARAFVAPALRPVHQAMQPSRLSEFITLVRERFEEAAREGEAPVLVTSSNIRPFVRGIVERFRAQTPVLSQGEIHPRARLKTVSSI